MISSIFSIPAAGKPLHSDFADKAAAVDGEMADVIGNISMVKAFGGLLREHHRFDTTVARELKARHRSLLYLERLRLTHALVTVILIVGLLAWAIRLWQRHEATVGDVVLVCTLGISVLSATRDFAVALVDITQHFARLSEALVTLLSPHELTDHPQAAALAPKGGAGIVFERMSTPIRWDRQVFDQFTLAVEPGQRIGLVRCVGRREVDPPRAAAEILRFAARSHIDRWTRHLACDAGEPQTGDRRRAARRRASQPFAHGEHPLWTSGSDRYRGLERVGRRPMR
jgi:ATP-binding cassette subfamily B protein